MADLVTMIRHVLGFERRTPESEWAKAKMAEQEQIIRALDAQVDAQRKSGTIMKRRAGEQ